MAGEKKKIKSIKVIIEPSEERIDLVEFVESVLNWEDPGKKREK